MSTETSTKVVKAAYDYLINVLLASGTPVNKLSDFRVEELALDEATKNYKVTLSYEVGGDFTFDKKREFKDFDVTEAGVVLAMRIRKI